MRIHLDYMDYEITPDKDDFKISNIKIKDTRVPMIHVFADIAERNGSVKEMIRICEIVEPMNRFVSALNFGVMEMTDPCNGLER